MKINIFVDLTHCYYGKYTCKTKFSCIILIHSFLLISNLKCLRPAAFTTFIYILSSIVRILTRNFVDKISILLLKKRDKCFITNITE